MNRTDTDTDSDTNRGGTGADDRLLPVLLICAQAAVWPGAELMRGAVPPSSALLVAALVAGLVTAALALRRTRPVVALVVVAAACASGAGPLPTGAMAVLGTAGVALALFTVATERDTFTAVLCLVTLAVWQLLYGLTLHGLSDRNGLDLVLTALLYVVACGAGLLVRRARRARRTAEQLLRRAEADRHRLPAVERRRMERELHDVSAHHLTAVVVTAGAALGLRDRRPEMAAEALEFAAETGREVTRALGAVRAPAPTREDLPSPEERLRALVAGFRRLDQEVDCEIDPLPDGTVADAAYGIVREALTNVARHAAGAQTRVLCRYGDTRTDVVVTSAAPPAGSAAHGAGLGGGRGQGFLRSRAREAGGTLTSGPTADGGWEVRAVLPGRTAAPVERSAGWSYRLAQVTAAVGLCVQPLLPVLVIRTSTASSSSHVSAGVLFALLAAAQAVALLWLRRAPRAAQGVLFGLALLWPLAMATGEYTGPVLLPPALSMLATCAALAADAARTAAAASDETRPAAGPSPAESRRRARLDALPVLPVAAVAVHAVAATAAVLDRGTTIPAWVVAASATAGASLAVGAARLAGTLRGRRDRTARGTQDERLAAWTEEAVRDAWAERRRIAAGLETTVLARTAGMVAEAEAGRLDTTAERAREALAAMRALLDTVREGETEPDLRPQPTLQALDLLAHQSQATGRDVEIRLTDRVPERLPTAVDLAAYHAAEMVLAAGGDEPAMLELDADDGTLTLTATGVPRAARPAVRERLLARVAALGGTLTTDAPDTVRLRLPLVPDQGDEERGDEEQGREEQNHEEPSHEEQSHEEGER
ncbi:histidine kinase [Streptomyces phaeochromogenes]|uniref:histidine kinase n=1 Tax=Streptomyces phaeochromogenes TaxID=1923 RepID=A0ABZ1H565_STRPH|nr:histidine kinase [Streptomyces phaeochromogenes]WSD12520.1 histidine kinase [Streptomyces phaeochromogenes]